ncbi:DUF2301 domain-containing membrane protein [Parasynechococcus sp.]|uniref:DUF2301 domain-containing membrane protein n=1 Tax=Parasynechococcus sp. TaxID=3101203 RepID=UPI003704B8F6
MSSAVDPQFEGVYGPYTITASDRKDVQSYRFALLMSGLAFSAGLTQWWQLGGEWAWLWLVPLCGGLGVALQTIHIYLRPLHRALQLFWLLGCVGWLGLIALNGPGQALARIADQPLWILAIGPLFAAMAGIGFKEFFCFRRVEAIGLTLLLPIALLGRLLQWIDAATSLGMLLIAAGLFVVLALRKFGTEAAADVGDKSVFAYLDGQVSADGP